MSSLLEQAIVDAKALRDAALKNAEQMVVEKYSDQIKDAVATLLEQEPEEEELAAEEEPMDMGMDADPMAEPAEEDPLAMDDAEEGEESELDASDEAMLDGVPASDVGTIELDLDAIEKKIAEIESEEGPDALEELEDDMVDHEDLAASMSDDIVASADADSLMTEEELEESLFAEISEALKVDIKPQKRGWMGVSNEELDLAVEMELARVQDDQVKEDLKDLKSALNKLEENNNSLSRHNKNITNENKQLEEELEMYKGAVQQLKEKFDVVNTSNAKLLYINRTLDCGSLNERQKKKIVEAIANADDAREAKVIYETLQNTVETKKEEKGPESLSEAVNRGSSLLVRAREEKRTTSADIFADRMQRLAGIKKQ
tara:strand:- start:479 stop:1600 length:1122 start_codon:yes stop_codon:yes gene_type:complete